VTRVQGCLETPTRSESKAAARAVLLQPGGGEVGTARSLVAFLSRKKREGGGDESSCAPSSDLIPVQSADSVGRLLDWIDSSQSVTLGTRKVASFA